MNRDQQILLLKRVDASIILSDYIKKKGTLCSEAQIKLFDFHDAKTLVWNYIQYAVLCHQAQLKMFELPNAEEVVMKYIQKYLVNF